MTFYFYDLETSGVNPREQRVMQFAGQRTDMNLNPIGEPDNYLIKLSDDIVPEPYAILVTGITPQQTVADGITEAEFLKIFHESIAVPDTIMVGFNTVRFDDEFMRYMLYRNYYDPYEWQWQDGRSRWDLLDLVRMTRALRPEGIKWPFDVKGKPTNRLELLTALNGIEHTDAHDALSDVNASIAIARLIKKLQPKLFDFLLEMRSKQKVAELALSGKPFIYTSGKYDSEYEKTTIVATIAEASKRQGVLVFDLRYNPRKFEKLSVQELAEAWRRRKDDPGPRLPIKTLQFNRCPAIAPLSVLDTASEKRLKLDMQKIKYHLGELQEMGNWVGRVLEAQELLDKKMQAKFLDVSSTVDAQLYDGFFDERDKNMMSAVRAADPEELADVSGKFKDRRLKELLPLYKARNFPNALTGEERAEWERYRTEKLLAGKEKSQLARFFNQLSEIEGKGNLTDHQRYLLEELQLYGQSIMPTDD